MKVGRRAAFMAKLRKFGTVRMITGSKTALAVIHW